jgi:hypothetical protein
MQQLWAWNLHGHSGCAVSVPSIAAAWVDWSKILLWRLLIHEVSLAMFSLVQCVVGRFTGNVMVDVQVGGGPRQGTVV